MQVHGPFSLDEATEREWLIPNGLGGYASSSLCGMNTRRYHGLLVAALRPPGQRTLLVSKMEESIIVGDTVHHLSTNQYPGVYHPDGYRYLRTFELDGERVIQRFAAGGVELEKQVTMVYGENTTRICYRNTGTVPCTLTLTPLVNARDFHGETRPDDLHFTVHHDAWAFGPSVHVKPYWMPDGFWLYADAGAWQEEQTWYRNMLYIWEYRRGLTHVDNHFSPGHFHLVLEPGNDIYVTLSTLAPPETGEGAAITAPASPAVEFPIPADELPEIRQLYHTAHSFLVQRSSIHREDIVHGRTVIAGYHWFGDWGRDTMIALPGLCLLTGRYEDAAEILRTFAAARRNGLLPNLFMESGGGEAYNTVDASLWFIYAVERYYHATQDRVLVNELRSAMEEIISAYRNGTDFGIHMEEDCLINASAHGWQLTWMDAKVGDWVVTPRMGKPVEINALWYNALRVMETFGREFRWPGDYGSFAEQVRRHYAAFWNPHGGYLYDVLGDQPDARIRPNQIFAVSLPYSPLDLNQARSVVATVERYLLTPYGLRTLAPHDADYRGHYGGNVWERDGAYHQGTVWAWLIGPYIDAYLRVNGNTERAKATGRLLLKPLLGHLWEACVGSISEIFEGNPPHFPRGTVSQAWSVAEFLRVWQKCKG